MGRLKGACEKPFRPASKTAVFEVPCSFGTAVLDECIRRQSQRFLSSTRLRHGICIAVFGVQKAPAPARAGAGLYKKWKGPVWRGALSPVLKGGKRRQAPEKEMQTRARQIWYVACRSARHMCRTGGNEWRNEAKTIHGPRRFKCVFWLYFFVFSLDGTLFPAYNAYYVSSWPCVPMCQKYAENICAFRRFLPRQKGRLTRCYEEAEHAEKIRSGRKLW